MSDIYLRLGELAPTDVRLYPAGPDTGGSTFTIETEDAAPAADSAARLLAVARSLVDVAPATDTVVTEFDPVAVYQIDLADHAPASDSVAFGPWAYLRSVVDSAPASDSVAYFLITAGHPDDEPADVELTRSATWLLLTDGRHALELTDAQARQALLDPDVALEMVDPETFARLVDARATITVAPTLAP